MYLAHFGLTEAPFTITPDPRYLFMSDRHREAMAHLTFGVTQGGGFVQLTGEVGTGKTTICRCMLTQLPESIDVALITNPRISELELLATLCDELRIEYPEPATSKILLDRLNQRLLASHAAGRRTVLIIDEAQNLSRQVLERVRLLTNLETAKEKLLQIILIGQPELAETLDRPDLRQLAQRITARYSLVPLSARETGEYIAHRLAVAGCHRKVFTRGAIKKIFKRSKGVPRIINVVCDRALLGAYASNISEVDTATVKQAIYELYGDETSDSGGMRSWLRYGALGVGALAAAGFVGWLLGVSGPSTDAARSTTASEITTPEKSDKSVAQSETSVTSEAVAGQVPETSPVTEEAAGAEQPATDNSVEAPAVALTPAATDAQAEGAPVPPGMTELAPKADADTASPVLIETPETPSASSSETDDAAETAASSEAPAALTVAMAAPRDSTSAKPVDATPAAGATAAGKEILDSVLATGDDSRLNQAFSRLAGLWGVSIDGADGSVCAAADTHGLKCINANGDWDSLRRFDRPVLLRLKTPADAGQRYMVVRNLDDLDGQVVIGGRGVSYPLSDIESVWSGDFVMLWRPAVSRTVLEQGARGEDVLWLRRALNFVALNDGNITPGDIESEEFDATLRERVEQFQKLNALSERGVVGAETLITLNSIVQSGMPRLTRF